MCKGVRMLKNTKFLVFLRSKGFNASKLANKLGVSERSIQYWINGRNKPSLIQLINMSKLFDLKIETIYGMFKNNNER